MDFKPFSHLLPCAKMACLEAIKPFSHLKPCANMDWLEATLVTHTSYFMVYGSRNMVHCIGYAWAVMGCVYVWCHVFGRDNDEPHELCDGWDMNELCARLGLMTGAQGWGQG